MDREAGGVSLIVGAGGPTGGPFIWAALAAIEERTGWVPSSATKIVGTSAGAFVAAALPEQTTPVDGSIESLAGLANGEQFVPTFAVSAVGRIRRAARYPIARLAPTSKERAEYNTPGDPFHRGATAVTVSRSGQRVEHHLHEVADAQAVVRASAAIPFVNGPIDIDGTLHVDGAVNSPTNADLAGTPELIVVIAPMIPASGGSIIDRSHRALLCTELAAPLRRSIPVVAVLPSPQAHSDRRNRDPFEREGRVAVNRL